MTVQRLDDYGYTCQWFAGRKLEAGRFPPDSLLLVSESDSKAS